jgi:cytochrome c553
MFNFCSNIANGLTLAALLVATSAFAEGDTANPLKGIIEPDVENASTIKLRTGTGDPVAGREKSLLCQGCHGQYGISTEPLIPKLAGQYANYIEKEIRNYQSGIRSHQIMNAMAGTIDSDQDLADIAAYFASQDKMKGDGSEGESVGKEIFLHGDLSKMRLGCVNCHGVRGKGLEAKISMFPVIGGQHKDYIRRQLMNFRDGYRTNSPNGIMNRITNSLTDSEIESLAEYISSVQ